MITFVYNVYSFMLIIYVLQKIEQKFCTIILQPIRLYELLFFLPIYFLKLNLFAYLVLSSLFTLAWMDTRLKEVSHRLLSVYFIMIFIHYINNPLPINTISLFICLALYGFSYLTNGLGLGDVYIYFGLSFILTLSDFLTVFRYSLWIALFVELIKKTKTSFAFIPYIYIGLILFLTLNLY